MIVEPDVQETVVLTAHPLQRAGAYALVALGGARTLSELGSAQFRAAVEHMTADALRAAMVTDTNAEDGFWLKASGSFFPNSKMNHPLRLAKLDGLEAEVRRWRSLPLSDTWPEVGCALCGRQAVGFYGKSDVALAESAAYRNTVPHGHGGLALCWPCLCSFYALPYASVLTGGESSILHSFDEGFLLDQVVRQVRVNRRHITVGAAVSKQPLGTHAAALSRLRRYEGTLRDGVELLIFSNNNREQKLQAYALSQPLAEWLRRSSRGSRRAGFTALLRAHRSVNQPGAKALARDVFREPGRVMGNVTRYLVVRVEKALSVPRDAPVLAVLCREFALEVLDMNKENIDLVKAVGSNLSRVIAADTVSGPLTGLVRAAKSPARLQSLLQTMSTKWLLAPPAGVTGPLLTTRQFEVLFDPDGQSWLYRQLLVIAVLEELSVAGWRPTDARAASDDFDEDSADNAVSDDLFMEEEGVDA